MLIQENYERFLRYYLVDKEPALQTITSNSRHSVPNCALIDQNPAQVIERQGPWQEFEQLVNEKALNCDQAAVDGDKAEPGSPAEADSENEGSETEILKIGQAFSEKKILIWMRSLKKKKKKSNNVRAMEQTKSRVSIEQQNFRESAQIQRTKILF